MKRFFKCESGQATIEYAMLILVIVSAIVTIGVVFRNKIKELFEGPLGNYIQKNFFSPESLHRLPVRIPR